MRWGRVGLSIAAAVGAAGYLALYVVLIRSQEGSPLAWYVGLVAAGGVFAGAGVFRRMAVASLVGACVLSLAGVLAAPSIGMVALLVAALAFGAFFTTLATSDRPSS